jgi:hypothetical protein
LVPTGDEEPEPVVVGGPEGAEVLAGGVGAAVVDDEEAPVLDRLGPDAGHRLRHP